MGKQWSEKEITKFIGLINNYPLNVVLRKINEFHQRNNTGIVRTLEAVKGKSRELGYSLKATENNMSANEWARALGLKNIGRVRNWIVERGLKCRKKDYRLYTISKKEMLQFALAKPHLFADIDPDNLEYYFGKEAKDIILQYKGKCPGFQRNAKKIQRLDNNKIYQSIYKASAELKMAKISVKREASKGIWLKYV